MYSRIWESTHGFNHRNHRQVTDFQHGHQDRPVDAEHTWTQIGLDNGVGLDRWLLKKNSIENIEDAHKLDL